MSLGASAIDSYRNDRCAGAVRSVVLRQRCHYLSRNRGQLRPKLWTGSRTGNETSDHRRSVQDLWQEARGEMTPHHLQLAWPTHADVTVTRISIHTLVKPDSPAIGSCAERDTSRTQHPELMPASVRPTLSKSCDGREATPVAAGRSAAVAGNSSLTPTWSRIMM